MRRVLIFSGIFAAFLAISLPAHAAKGIVLSGGGSGSILLTEKGSGAISELGNGIEYRFEIPDPPYFPRVSDGVRFDIVPDPIRPGQEMAINIVREIEGTLITTPQSNPITSNAGQSVLIQGAQINGKITVNGGSIVIVGGSVIDGKVDCGNNGTLAVLGCRISGKLDSRTNNLLVGRNSIVGPVTSEGDRFISIRNCTIEGKLEIKSTPTEGCSIGGNTVNGKIVAPATCTP